MWNKWHWSCAHHNSTLNTIKTVLTKEVFNTSICQLYRPLLATTLLLSHSLFIQRYKPISFFLFVKSTTQSGQYTTTSVLPHSYHFLHPATYESQLSQCTRRLITAHCKRASHGHSFSPRLPMSYPVNLIVIRTPQR